MRPPCPLRAEVGAWQRLASRPCRAKDRQRRKYTTTVVRRTREDVHQRAQWILRWRARSTTRASSPHRRNSRSFLEEYGTSPASSGVRRRSSAARLVFRAPARYATEVETTPERRHHVQNGSTVTLSGQEIQTDIRVGLGPPTDVCRPDVSAVIRRDVKRPRTRSFMESVQTRKV